MIDPVVERQFSDTKELLALWNSFHQFFNLAVKGENITPEKETQFMELKSRIAMLHDSFMDALTTNQNVGQDVLTIITRAITLKHLGRLSTAETKKMEIEWHESYLLLNDTIAELDHRREELAQINETQYRAKKAAGAARQKAGKFFGSFYFKLAVTLAVLLGATIGVQMLGIYDYDELGKKPALTTPYQWGKYVVRKFKPDSPWVNIEVVPRKGYASWPSGLKAPKTITDVTKEEGAREVAQKAAPLGIAGPLNAALAGAQDYRKEESEKSGSKPVEIHSFWYPTAAEAKDALDIWNDAKAKNTQSLPLLTEMTIFRDTNVVIAIMVQDHELLNRMQEYVYGNKL